MVAAGVVGVTFVMEKTVRVRAVGVSVAVGTVTDEVEGVAADATADEEVVVAAADVEFVDEDDAWAAAALFWRLAWAVAELVAELLLVADVAGVAGVGATVGAAAGTVAGTMAGDA